MDQRNFVVAILLAVVILVGYEYFLAPSPLPPLTEDSLPAPQGEDGSVPMADAPSATPSAPTSRNDLATAPPLPDGTTTPAPEGVTRETTLSETARVPIDAPRLRGSISLKGARIDDLILVDYREELDPQSPQIVLLSPPTPSSGYFSTFGWVASGDVAVPGPDSDWQAEEGAVLSADRPLTLRWDNGAGLVFERTLELDDNYMMTVTQRVINRGGEAATLFPFGSVQRRGTPEVSGFFILHEGLTGYLDGALKETDYDDLADEVIREGGQEVHGVQRYDSTGGWLGITDKYWQAVLIPDQESAIKARYTHQLVANTDRYQVDYLGPGVTVEAGTSQEVSSRLFAGAKETQLLDMYEAEFGIPEFWRAVDFGWFWFLTKPIFEALHQIYIWFGNYGVAILLITVAVKLVFFPLANKSYRAMSKMKKLQPEMIKLRDRFGDDKARLNQEMMSLYKREGANPISGCLPVLIQIPVFFSLYKVLFVTIEMRHAPFFGWVRDLSQPDPTTIFNLFGLIPWTPPDLLAHFGIWPIIMGASMFLQQKLNPQPADPIQAKIFLYMPLLFTVLLANFPAGLVIYWAWNNTLSIAQQWVIMRRMGVT